MRQKFIQFFDVNTDPDQFSVFKVYAGGSIVKKRLLPWFGAYKYYKLGKVTVKCVPAATLPVDPTGLSYEAGESTVDPRDQFNPGLIRITNGENIDDEYAYDYNRYYATMLDSRWYKFRLQSGFTRSAIPLVWNSAMNGQELFPGASLHDYNGEYMRLQKTLAQRVKMSFGDQYSLDDTTEPIVSPNLTGEGSPVSCKLTAISDSPDGSWETVKIQPSHRPDSDLRLGQLFTDSNLMAANIGTDPYHYPIQSGRVKLGWMPTDALIGFNGGFAPIPEVELMTFVFPQAFKTKFYYRIFVESTVYFKDPVVIDPIIAGETGSAIDRYVSLHNLGGDYNYTVPGGATNDVSNVKRSQDETL